MTDWEKLKVTDLKEELRSRGIPLTGLKLKQQLIDKLNEVETDSSNENQNGQADNDDDVELADADSPQDSPEVISTQELTTKEEQAGGSEGHSPGSNVKEEAEDGLDNSSQKDSAEAKDNEHEKTFTWDTQSTTPADEVTGEERVERLPDDLPAELKKEESRARDGTTPPPVEVETTAEEKAIQKYDPFIPQESSETGPGESVVVKASDHERNTEAEDTQQSYEVTQSLDEHIHVNEDEASNTDRANSTRVPTPEILDDRRKRKRRSLTPGPESQDIAQKRAKTSDIVQAVTPRELDALEKVQQATDASQAIRHPELANNTSKVDMIGHGKDEKADDDGNSAMDIVPKTKSPTPEAHSPIKSRSPSEPLFERDVSPAIHVATGSLYIRNFKRPLHHATLRSHVSSLAGSANNDAVKVFYLDSIRTHAFISFTSVIAASRVRNAMHGTRFPDEPMREPLWIDFIPDNKVQEWIDHESGSDSRFGGDRGSSKKYEVIYSNTRHGVEAILQEVSVIGVRNQRPSFQQPTSNRIVPQDPTASGAVTSGIHPLRVALIPQSPSSSRRQQRPQPAPKPSDPGKGFRALDELFSSTTAKPKLYYKLPAQTLIDDRLDMIRGLRVGHEQMGKSGDEGMKRYSFEKDERSGNEEWVDKGPEFGFGRRGQERLTGFGSSYGGGRGRGGPRGPRRGGDSWRGS